MCGHGAACLVHRRCARASLSRQSLNVQVDHALQGLRQDADVVVREMATWEAQLFQQGCVWVSTHDGGCEGAVGDDHKEHGEL